MANCNIPATSGHLKQYNRFCSTKIHLFLFWLICSPVAVGETFLTVTGDIWGPMEGGMGIHQTSEVVSITSDKIEVESGAYVISESTSICDENHAKIPLSDIKPGETVTISSLAESKEKEAIGIRKGLGLLRFGTMKPVPACE